MSTGATCSAGSLQRSRISGVSRARSWALAASLLALALILLPLALSGRHDSGTRMASRPVTGSQARQTASSSVSPKTARTYGKLPLSFVSNREQVDSQVRYYAQTSNASFYFTKHKAVLIAL